jgi:hypothetical protein
MTLSQNHHMSRHGSFPVLIFAVISVWAGGVAANFASAQDGLFGVVRVVNPSQVQAQIYTRNVNFYGAQQWVPIAVVQPGSFIDLPRVPNGQWFGVRLQNGRSFPAWQVVYTDPNKPFFLYTLP